MCGTGTAVIGPEWGLVPLIVLVPGYLWLRQGEHREGRTWLGLAAIVYLDVLLSLVFLPLPLPPYTVTVQGCPYVYAQPFYTIAAAFEAGAPLTRLEYLVGNLLAFIPVGVLVPSLRPGGRRPWLTAVLAGFVLSVAIESGQLVGTVLVGYPYRQADIDDVIVNTLGAAVGYGFLASAGAIVSALAVRRREE